MGWFAVYYVSAVRRTHISRGGAGVARRAHNPKVGSSNLPPATKLRNAGILVIPAFFRIFSLSDVVVNSRSKPMYSRLFGRREGGTTTSKQKCPLPHRRRPGRRRRRREQLFICSTFFTGKRGNCRNHTQDALDYLDNLAFFASPLPRELPSKHTIFAPQ